MTLEKLWMGFCLALVLCFYGALNYAIYHLIVHTEEMKWELEQWNDK